MTEIGLFMLTSGIVVGVAGCVLLMLLIAIQAWFDERDAVPAVIFLFLAWFAVGFALLVAGKR